MTFVEEFGEFRGEAGHFLLKRFTVIFLFGYADIATRREDIVLLGDVVERSDRTETFLVLQCTGFELTESVGDNYIAHLRENRISYIFAGKAKLDIPLALKKLKDLFSINSVMLSGGGAINWSFLQAGCIDELSLLIAPSTDGLRDTATTFDRSVFLSGGVPVGFTLKEAKRVQPDGVWLTYEPNNIKR